MLQRKYPVLERLIWEKGLFKKDIAEQLDVSVAQFLRKLNGEYRFWLDEAFILQKKFFPDITVEELFRN